MDEISKEMNIENLKLKIENQSKVLKELTKENDELYHQYNHLIIRNGKMLKRTDDYQKIIDDLHIRNEELQLINSNLMKLNDNLRKRNNSSDIMNEPIHERQEADRKVVEKLESEFNIDELYVHWKNYPGQIAHNEPNLRKQIVMLVHLYNTNSLRAEDLFRKSGVGGVTGARYVSTLKKFELIKYTGARKKGHYEITSKGKSFIEDTPSVRNKFQEQNGSLSL